MVAWEEQITRGRVPEWADKYVDYAALKRKLERTFPEADKRPRYHAAVSSMTRKSKRHDKSTLFEQAISGESEGLPDIDEIAELDDGPMSPLLRSEESNKALKAVSSAVDDFSELIMRELHKAEKFYGEACDDLERKVDTYLESAEGSAAGARGLSSGRPDAVQSMRSLSSSSKGFAAGAGGLGGEGAPQDSELDNLYLRCVRLTEFALLNSEAARKIAKKFDKRILSEGKYQDILKQRLMSSALADKPASNQFTGERARQRRRRLEVLLTPEHAAELRTVAGKPPQRNPSGMIKVSKQGAFRPIRGLVALSLAFAVFGALPKLVSLEPEALKCAGLLTFIVSLWVGEACPFEGTAMLVPPLAVLLNVIEGDDVEDRAKKAIAQIFSGTLYVALAGFVMTSVFASAGIDGIVADVLISRLYSRPKLFLLSLMFFGVLLSALISNVTAPLLILQALRPMLRDAPTDSRFSRATLLAIAFSCNAGGMATPISSPQNIAAMSILQASGGSVEWAQWFAVSMPAAALTVLAGWMCILVLHSVDLSDDEKKRVEANGGSVKTSSETRRLHDLHKIDAQSLSRVQVFSLIVAALALCVFAIPAFSKAIGGTAIASLLFVGIVICAGAIPKTTFNGYSWHLLFLIGGGNVLGVAVEDSGLLAAATEPIQSLLAGQGAGVLAVVLVLILAVATTFLSHTVAALVLMPLCVQLGQKSGGHAEAITVLCGLACSSACALPFSSFPNVSCISASDDDNVKYLTVMHFLRAGIPATVLTALSLCAVWPIAAMALPPHDLSV